MVAKALPIRLSVGPIPKPARLSEPTNCWYVLDFSNRTFHEFVADVVRRDIDDPKYNYASSSKANRLRQVWKIESNDTVGVLTRQMVDYDSTVPSVDQSLVPQAQRIAARLLDSAPVPELDAIIAIIDDRTFETLAKSVRVASDSWSFKARPIRDARCRH
jgi:hypothetical protein